MNLPWPDWNLEWPTSWSPRTQWLVDYLPKDLGQLVSEYAASFEICWYFGVDAILSKHDFSALDIKPFTNKTGFYMNGSKYISGIATIRMLDHMRWLDLLSDHTWRIRTYGSTVIRNSGMRKIYIDQMNKYYPRDSYVIWDMANPSNEPASDIQSCVVPILIAHHEQWPMFGRVTFKADVF
jgi:hypothetical protein